MPARIPVPSLDEIAETLWGPEVETDDEEADR